MWTIFEVNLEEPWDRLTKSPYGGREHDSKAMQVGIARVIYSILRKDETKVRKRSGYARRHCPLAQADNRQELLEEQKVYRIVWPTQTPDLNPIDNLYKYI